MQVRGVKGNVVERADLMQQNINYHKVQETETKEHLYMSEMEEAKRKENKREH
jgi:hypothetical protein